MAKECDCPICRRPGNHAARQKIEPRTYLRHLVAADCHRSFHGQHQAGCVYCERAVSLDEFGLPDCVSLLAHLKKENT